MTKTLEDRMKRFENMFNAYVTMHDLTRMTRREDYQRKAYLDRWRMTNYVENVTIRMMEAEEAVERLIEVGDVLLNQDGMDNDVVTAAENKWRKLVDEWRQR